MRLWKIGTAEIDADSGKREDNLKSPDDSSNLEIETYLARYLGRADKVFKTGSAIYQTSTHTFDDWDAMANAFDNRVNMVLFYGCQLNPTVQVAEEVLARLAGAERARLYGSGMAAITASLLASLKTGDHIVAVNGFMALRVGSWQIGFLKKVGITALFVSALSPEASFKYALPQIR